jgi:hypothetical protein
MFDKCDFQVKEEIFDGEEAEMFPSPISRFFVSDKERHKIRKI